MIITNIERTYTSKCQKCFTSYFLDGTYKDFITVENQIKFLSFHISDMDLIYNVQYLKLYLVFSKVLNSNSLIDLAIIFIFEGLSHSKIPKSMTSSLYISKTIFNSFFLVLSYLKMIIGSFSILSSYYEICYHTCINSFYRCIFEISLSLSLSHVYLLDT